MMQHDNDNAPTGKTGLRFLSVCSGIEAASVAWHPLGWLGKRIAQFMPQMPNEKPAAANDNDGVRDEKAA